MRQLQLFDPNLHWFCGRSNADEESLYYDEDFSPAELKTEDDNAKRKRERILQDAEKRKHTVMNALQIFAFDGSEAKPMQD